MSCRLQVKHWDNGDGGINCQNLNSQLTIEYLYPDPGCAFGRDFVGPTQFDCYTSGQTLAADQATAALGPADVLSTPGPQGRQCGTSGQAGGMALGSAEPSSSGSQGVTGGSISLVGDLGACFGGTGNASFSIGGISGAQGAPTLDLYFNSLNPTDSNDSGTGFTHSQGSRITVTSSTSLTMRRGGGRTIAFTRSGSNWVPQLPIAGKLIDAAGGGFDLKTQAGSLEQYDSTGRLLQTTSATGQATTYGYTGEYLTTVTGPFGHKIQIAWLNDEIRKVLGADGYGLTYTMDATKNNLVRITNPDNSYKQLLYEDTANPHAVTGLVDELGNRTLTISYDPTSGQVSSFERALGSGHVNVTYPSSSSVTSTDAQGVATTAQYGLVAGQRRMLSAANSVDGKTKGFTYDTNGNATGATDSEGSASGYVYDAANRVTSYTAAVGTPQQRTMGISYADDWLSIPGTITEPSVFAGYARTTTLTYSDSRFPALPTSAVIAGFRPDGLAVGRSVSMAYTTNGMVQSVDGPRTDVSDITSYSYWDCTTGAKCGQVHTVTDALGHITSFDTYDVAGRPTKITDANGTASAFTYNVRGLLTKIVETPVTGAGPVRTTVYTYNVAGRLTLVNLPDGTSASIGYDDSGRAVSATNAAGDRVEYGFDARGNRSVESVKDAGGNLQAQVQRAFDARNYAGTVTLGMGGDVRALPRANDSLGKVLTSGNGNGYTSTMSYDTLGRAIAQTDPLGGATAQGFDTSGGVATVNSPNGAGWSFTHDDLGNELTEVSPDRGMAVKTFDAAGNMISRIDARGVIASLVYDALNRVVSVDYSTGENVTYTWDACTRGVGRLCAVADASGVRSYSYDGLGRVLSMQWNPAGGGTFVTGYTWTNGDRLASVTYPSGRQVVYTRNNAGRIASVASGGASITSARTYRADGRMTAQTLGNGLVETRSYDTQGRMAGWTVAVSIGMSYGFDGAGNIVSSTFNGTTSNYGYDPLDRLNAIPGEVYTHDGNGNRTSDGVGSYAYQAGSNRMSASPMGSITLDPTGNVVGTWSGWSFSYNGQGQMAAAQYGSQASTYGYRSDGLRAWKVTPAATTFFHYDIFDRLIAESNSAGTVTREYIWDDQARPLAQIAQGAKTFLHIDNLGTPRIGTNQAGAVVWQWISRPYGSDAPTGSATVNLRFPGQYFDAETGFNYSWWRYYDQNSGQYVQSDPIGLAGGVNTYAYVNGDPLMYYDPYGLYSFDEFSDDSANFSAGWGDMLSFGITARIREGFDIGSVNKCSAFYKGGEVFGFANGLALGWAQGTKAAAKAASGNNWANFSHSLFPKRFLKQADNPAANWMNQVGNRLNGDFVTPALHTRMDAAAQFGLSREWLAANPLFSPLRQLVNRMPYVPGAAAYGAGSAAMNSCGCDN